MWVTPASSFRQYLGMEANKTINAYLIYGLLIAGVSSQELRAQSHAANSDIANLGIRKEERSPKASVEFPSGHSIMEHKNGVVLKDANAKILTFGRNLEELKTKIISLDKTVLGDNDKSNLVSKINANPLLKNFLNNTHCIKKPDLLNVQVEPSDDLIAMFKQQRESGSGPSREMIISFNSINDNGLHGGLSQAGIKDTGNDKAGLTFGMELDALVKRGNDSVNYSLLSHLYTRPTTVDGNSRNANGSRYQESMEQNALNVSVVKSRDPSGNDTYFMRFEGEIGCQKDDTGISQSIQKYWHNQLSQGGSLENVAHMEEEAYIAAKAGVGRIMQIDLNGKTKISTMVETGLQGNSLTKENNAAYCSASATLIAGYCSLEIFGEVNSSGHQKIGAEVVVPLSEKVSASTGLYRFRNQHTQEYGDEDALYSLGFKFKY